MIFAHVLGHNGFWSMVLDASACINMYYNIEMNIIMKNQASSYFSLRILNHTLLWGCEDGDMDGEKE